MMELTAAATSGCLTTNFQWFLFEFFSSSGASSARQKQFSAAAARRVSIQISDDSRDADGRRTARLIRLSRATEANLPKLNKQTAKVEHRQKSRTK